MTENEEKRQRIAECASRIEVAWQMMVKELREIERLTKSDMTTIGVTLRMFLASINDFFGKMSTQYRKADIKSSVTDVLDEVQQKINEKRGD